MEIRRYTWEEDHREGGPYIFRIVRASEYRSWDGYFELLEEIQRWCEDRFEKAHPHRWRRSDAHFWFKHPIEAFEFKMRWC